MKNINALIALALLSSSAIAQVNLKGQPTKQSMDRYDQLNIACRGGSGDNPKTWNACTQRDELEQTIKAEGWCYVGGWKKCHSAKKPALPASEKWREKQIQVGAKQDCFLMSGTTSLVPLWRDNGIPLSTVYSNVEKVIFQTAATEAERKEWHQLVSAIYSSKVTGYEVEQRLRPQCVSMPDGN